MKWILALGLFGIGLISLLIFCRSEEVSLGDRASFKPVESAALEPASGYDPDSNDFQLESVRREPAEPQIPEPLDLRLQDLEGHGVANARVQLYSLDTGIEIGSFVSDSEGSVRMVHVPTCGAIAIANTVSTLQRMSGSGLIQPIGGLHKNVIRLSSDQTAIVGLILKGGEPVSGLRVPGYVVEDGETDDNGFFKLGDYSGDTAVVRIGAGPYPLFEEQFSIRQGETHFCRAVLPSGGIQVFLKPPGGGILELDGILVSLQQLPVSVQGFQRFASTDAAGEAVFEDVPEGEYLVSSGRFADMRPNYEGTGPWAPAFQLLQISDGWAEAHLALVLPATLKYRVLDAEKGWQVPALVHYSCDDAGVVNDWKFPIHPESEGTSTLLLPPGNVKVFAANSESGWGELSLALSPGQIIEADILLSRELPSLTLNLFGEQAESMDEFLIHDEWGGLVWYGSGGAVETSFNFSSSDGNHETALESEEDVAGLPGFTFTVPALPFGVYSVSCFSDRSIIASGTIGLVADSVLNLYIMEK